MNLADGRYAKCSVALTLPHGIALGEAEGGEAAEGEPPEGFGALNQEAVVRALMRVGTSAPCRLAEVVEGGDAQPTSSSVERLDANAAGTGRHLCQIPPERPANADPLEQLGIRDAQQRAGLLHHLAAQPVPHEHRGHVGASSALDAAAPDHPASVDRRAVQYPVGPASV